MTRRRVLAFAAAVELGTGVALMIDPGLVVQWLLGEQAVGMAVLLGRCFGIALLALGIACWPQARSTPSGNAPLRGMGIYNVLIAAYLGVLGTVANLRGPLLWPAVGLHTFVALLLLWPRRSEYDLRTTRE